MSTRPAEQLKSVATSLAELLSSGKADPKLVRSMLEKLGFTNNSAEQPKNTKRAASGNIGIYSPVIINDETHYRRNEAFKDRWFLFADVDTIPPKTQRKRVVLLGESVARGFLLDPGYTPAGVLESMLGNEDFEVVDLAETNLSLEGLKTRFEECIALQPDVVIFFAGNNWRTDIEVNVLNNPQYLLKLVEGIKKHHGIAGLKPVIEEIFASLIHSFLNDVHVLAAAHRVKLVFAIPEFNLMDYRSTPGERLITKLPGEGMRQWIAERKQAENNPERHAKNMILLDPTHPLGYELLADCELMHGNYEEARKDLELAKDSALFFRSNSKPRIYSIIRNTILSQAPQYGIEVVDLAAVFAEHVNLPDRTLFFDYCHLTAKGIHVAIEAVAKQISSNAKPAQLQPRPWVNAMGHLFAAIHNAHWGQEYEILYHHCSQALHYSKDIARHMIHYCEMASRRTPNILCKSFEVLVAEFKSDKHINALKSPRNGKGLELDLVNAMIAALKDNGIDIAAEVNELRLKEHNAANSVNLLSSHYHVRSYDEYLGTRASYFQGREPVSRFFLPCNKDTSVTLTLTLRTPATAGTASVIVNNKKIIGLDVSETWSDHTITIPVDKLVKGINELAIEWPIPVNNSNGSELLSMKPGANLLLDAVYCVFGEIIHFKAEPVAVSTAPQTTSTIINYSVS